MMLHVVMLVVLFQVREPDGFLIEPTSTAEGIIFTDNHCSTLYLLGNGKKERLLSAPGCGRFYAVSQDKQLIGFKLIGEDGEQTPVLYDMRNRRVERLWNAVAHAGQVSFTRAGGIAFTIGNELIVKFGEELRHYPLRGYANLAPISAGGRYVVYNGENDQLWLHDLAEGTEGTITDGFQGYHSPGWSPSGDRIVYMSLGGDIYVYDLKTRTTHFIGAGRTPEWSFDGLRILYCVVDGSGPEITGADLFISKYDGTEKIQLTNTPDIFEFDPAFIAPQEIIYQTYDRRELCTGVIIENELRNITVLHREEQPLAVNYFNMMPDHNTRDSMDIPYLHQVYDTPDWFDGHWACAPTTAMMGIAYYRKLPSWDCWCSTPYGHICHFGRYICERYYYREVDYDLEAQDPVGTWAEGGYGYMWYGSNRPYTHMASYLNNHGIPSTRDDSPTFQEAIDEVNAGYPYGMCVGLTAAGHLVLAVGQVLNWHTLIFNDPYGNKNTPGYPSYDGKYARYDWPGYNNGYENLNAVYWCVTMHGDWEPQSDTLVDDLQFEDGFYLHTEPPSTMAYWWDRLSGYNNHIWWTYTTGAASEDTCYAVWTPLLPQSGEYGVFAFIPSSDANATAARYVVHHASGDQTVVINQSSYANEWVSLGTFQFAASDAYVYLGDATGTQGERIAFDAMRWSYSGPGIAESDRSDVETLSPYVPSIASRSIILNYRSPGNNTVVCTLYDVQGRCLSEHRADHIKTGNDRMEMDVSFLPPGVYFLHVEVGREATLHKCIIVH